MNAVLFVLGILIGEITAQMMAARPVPQAAPTLVNWRPLALPEGADADTVVMPRITAVYRPQVRCEADRQRDKYIAEFRRTLTPEQLASLGQPRWVLA